MIGVECSETAKSISPGNRPLAVADQRVGKRNEREQQRSSVQTLREMNGYDMKSVLNRPV